AASLVFGGLAAARRLARRRSRHRLIRGKHFEAHRRYPVFANAELFPGGGGVDDAVAHIRTAIIDAHLDHLVGGCVFDANDRAEGQAAMRGGHLVPVEALAIGRAMPLMRPAIPRRRADLAEAWLLGLEDTKIGGGRRGRRPRRGASGKEKGAARKR